MYLFHSFSGDTRVSVKREGLVLEKRLALYITSKSKLNLDE
jgi:hypothetical protein